MFENVIQIIDNIFGVSGDRFILGESVSPENIETCNGVAANDDKTRTCAFYALL